MSYLICSRRGDLQGRPLPEAQRLAYTNQRHPLLAQTADTLGGRLQATLKVAPTG